jgi:hypothetical protein
MAPEGKHCLHAYLPATEPYHIWKNVKKGRCRNGPSLPSSNPSCTHCKCVVLRHVSGR